MHKTFDLKIKDYIYTEEGKRIYNRLMFKEIAPRYDLITKVLSFGRDPVWKDRLIYELPEMDKPSCIDLACGTGDVTLRLAGKYPDGEITGLDITEEMIEKAKLKINRSNIKFMIADMIATHLPDNRFDLVTGSYALRNAPDLKKALKEILRIMKPNACAAFLDFSKPPGKLSKKARIAILKAWGSFWGILLHRNPEVYGYIAESLKLFPDRSQFKKLLRETGFCITKTQRHFLGFTETIYLRKPS